MDHLLSKEKACATRLGSRGTIYKTWPASEPGMALGGSFCLALRDQRPLPLFFENRILHNMFFLLLLREETGFSRIKQDKKRDQ